MGDESQTASEARSLSSLQHHRCPQRPLGGASTPPGRGSWTPQTPPTQYPACRQPHYRKDTHMKTPAYSELTPMSRGEVLERDRERDECRRKWQADHAKAKAKAAPLRGRRSPSP